MKEVHVTAAVIIQDNKILCVQRNENKYDYISKKNGNFREEKWKKIVCNKRNQ